MCEVTYIDEHTDAFDALHSKHSASHSMHSMHECISMHSCIEWRGGGLGSRPIFKKFNETYAPS